MRRIAGVVGLGLALCSAGCTPEEKRETTSAVSQRVTSGPCTFSAPPTGGTVTNVTFTVKTPSGVLPSDLALGTDLGALTAENGVHLVKDAGGNASLASVEATARLSIGTDVQAQSAYSELTGINVGDRTHLHGLVKTANTLTRGANVVIDGTITQNTSLKPLAVLSWNVAYPSLNRGSCDIQPDNTETIDPGTYGNITVKARSHLKLRAGTYYFTSLSLEATSVLNVDNAAGPVFVDVKNAFAWSGTVVETQPTKGNVVFALATTSAVNILTAIRGLIVAPSSTLTLASDGSSGHFGSFFAKTLDAQANATIHQRPLSSTAVCPGATDCNALCPCGAGGLCQVDAECQSGFTCQTPSGGGAKVCTPVSIDDGNPCTADAFSGGVVTHTPLPAGTSCADATVCNGAETCNATGTCVAGTPLVTNDNNPCTTDACNATSGVSHTPVAAGTSCADNTVCNGAETCNAGGTCVAGTPLVTNDNNPCTTDACNAATGVSHTPVTAGTSCTDGNACNGAETCNASGVCVGGTPPSVDDGNPCTADSCSASTGVSHTPVSAGTSCSDGNACNGTEICNGVAVCVGGTPPAVDDGNPCTIDACSAVTGVTHTPVATGTSCSDGNACNGAETCNTAAACVPGPPPSADDNNPCTIDACTAAGGVTHTPVAPGTGCGDGNSCNGAETCNAFGACVIGTPPGVDDNNPCTIDACTAAGGVTHTPVATGTSCSDGNSCNGAETCNGSGVCVAGTPVTCVASDSCHTPGTCNPSNGQCSNPAAPNGTSCADNTVCNGAETCQAGTCTPGTAPTVNDGNPCTADACDPIQGVTHAAVSNGTSCADNTVCNGAETCQSGTCTAGTPPVVDDGNPCTVDSCDSVTGAVHTPAPNGTSCADGNACNGSETCQVGTCTPGTAPAVDDGNPCTTDSCDPSSGAVHTPLAAGASCGDADLCNGSELCDGNGTCLPGTPVPIDASNPCQAGTCNSATGVVTYVPVAQGTACFIDACTAGACSGSGECTATGTSLVDDGDPCTVDTCDPVTGEKHRACAQLNPSVAHSVFLETQWLYSGSDPVQVGVAPGTIVPERASALRGRVTSRSGAPITNAIVTVLNHPELGYTETQASGAFDIVVNGGGALILQIEKSGYLTVQRAVAAGWSQWRPLDDVVMIAPDPIVTSVDLASPPSDIQVAQGSTQSDTSGTRSGTLLVPAGVQATMTNADGSTQQLDAMNIRITEYTVGATGLAAMPAALPPQSAYTYAFEVNADEAVAAGARSVQFSQPLPYYVDNFLGFPAGTVVPNGTYDRAAGAWVPETSGIVLKIVGNVGGLASLDVTGDGVADGSAQLTPLGITDAERQTLAQRYATGKSLWRVQLRHFTSPRDCNWPWRLPPDATPPTADAPTSPPTPDNPCGSAGGSYIECETQIFHEDIPLAGTPYGLHYSSAKVPGYRPSYRLNVPLTGSVPSSLSRVDLKIEVAGRSFKSSYPPVSNQVTSFDWDGLDADGRTVQGSQKAIITVSYIYVVTYRTGVSFGDVGGNSSLGLGRLEVPVDKITELPIGPAAAAGASVGGWMIDAHVAYDPTGRRVDFGNGQRQTSDGLPPTIRRLLQATCGNCPPPPDGSIPYPPDIFNPITFGGISIAARPDGSVYIAETSRIWRLDHEGHIYRIAGTGASGDPSGDGGSALAATLSIRSMDVGPDGSIYIAEFNRRIRKITPGGTIVPFAGTGAQGSAGDGGPASQASFVDQLVVAAAADGSVLVGEWQGSGSSGSRVRRIDTSGRIQTVAGHGPGGSITFEVPATNSYLLPQYIAAAPNGSFYVSHYVDGHSVIVRIDPDGIIHQVGGCVTDNCPIGDNLPATQQQLSVGGLAVDDQSRVLFTTGSIPSNYVRRIETTGKLTRIAGSPTPATFRDGAAAASVDPLLGALAVVPDGLIGLSSNNGTEVRKIQSPMPGISVGNLVVGRSSDGALMTFSGDGQGVDIRHGLTGVPLITFGYTSAGALDRLTDGSGLITRIDRDSSGKPEALEGPFGQRTSVELDGNGWLSAVVDPEGNRFEATYSQTGLLQTFTRPGNLMTEVTYDSDGRVLTDRDATGATMTLARTAQTDGWDVTRTTPLGHGTTYATRYTSVAQTRTQTQPSGEVRTFSIGTDKVTPIVSADGTREVTSEGPDDRLGLMWPVTSRITTLPSGLTYSETATHSYSNLNPTNILSFDSYTEQKAINNQIWRTVYTVPDRTFRTTTPAARTLLRVVDTLGRTTRTQIDGLLPVDFFYDSSGRLDHVIQGTGGLARTTQNAYVPNGDTSGYLASTTDAAGIATFFSRDALGRMLTETRSNVTTSFAWDPLGNLTSVIPPGKPAHSMIYTPVSLLESYQPPPAGLVSSATGYAYDADRMLRTETRPDSVQIVRTPDGAGRLDTVAIPGGVLKYDYYGPGAPSGAGKTSDIRGPYGVDLHFAYDGMLTKSTTWSGAVVGSISWSYNNDFNTSVETVSGATGTAQAFFGYDGDQLLTCASPTTCNPAGADALKLTRSSAGLVSNVSLGSTSETVTYNTFGELARQTATFAPSTPLVDITYDAAGFERDKLGRIVQRTEVVGGTTSVYRYTYDALRRLTDVTVNGTLAEHFEYDANGNRTLGYNAAVGTTYTGTYDDQDRLLSYGPFDFTYTANGELETKTNRDTSEAWLFQYDAFGNLLTVGLPDGDLIEYLVDGVGRRVGKKKNGVLLKQWIYRDALKPVSELDGSGALVSEFVYGSKSSVPDYVRRGGATYRVISDQLGSPRYVVNVANANDVPFTASFTSFGEVTGTGLDWMPFGFAGGLFDIDSRLVRFGSRDFVPPIGRWAAKDPFVFEGDQDNLFVYAGDDPVNLVDPDGTLAGAAAAAAVTAPIGGAGVAAVGAAGAAGYAFGYYVLGPWLFDGVFDALNQSDRDAFADDINKFNAHHGPPVDPDDGDADSDDATEDAKRPWNPQKPNRKKQGREPGEKKRQDPTWKPRNPPKEPPPHTPSRKNCK